uniref:SGF29 C-terminal domain-containing protein n=1 Tax=Ditylenchus dipsaci TaxID=166011 RepID=A0A915CW33_9BILA
MAIRILTPSPLVGAIPLPANEAIGVKGDFVAAFVEDVWILAEIQNQCAGGRYEIRDIDDDLERQLLLSQNRLIALPQYRADPRRDAHALFPKDAIVLALYPQTTCFYKGVVESQPSGPDEDYQIAFEDNTFPSGYSPTLPVPQRYVLTYKDIPALHKKKSAFIWMSKTIKMVCFDRRR